MRDIAADKAELVSLFVETLLYGMTTLPQTHFSSPCVWYLLSV
jgi:hypothetical protein